MTLQKRSSLSVVGRLSRCGHYRVLRLLCMLVGLVGVSSAMAAGPGLGNLTYADTELFTAIATLASPKGHGNVAMVNGYLMTIYSSDGGGTSSDGGFDFWDVSNPRAPVRFAQHDTADTHGLREAHGFGLSNSYAVDYVVTQGVDGIQFWDVTDPAAIRLVKYLKLPGISVGDYTGDWWVFWQAPYVYVAGVNQGLYIVDASDPENPQLKRQIPPSQLAGLNPGQVFAIGNLLIIVRNQAAGYASFDIGDPLNPALLGSITGRSGYSHIFAAGFILSSGGNGDIPQMYVHRVDHNGLFSYLGAVAGNSLGNGGYGSYQDGYFHSGFSNKYAKFRVRDDSGASVMQYVGDGSGKIAGADEDFGIVLGNLAFVGNDHGASALVVQQTQPDLKGPEVHWVHPLDGAAHLPLSSRVGLSMSDNVDFKSLSSATFSVSAVGGTALAGKYSVQLGLVNFSPDQPLQDNTQYVVRVSAIRDWAGNPGGSFTSSFSTGTLPPPTCVLAPTTGQEVGAAAEFLRPAVTGSAPITATWNFGDSTPALVNSSVTAVTHVYSTPGRYNVILSVANAEGTSACSVTQIIYQPLSAETPRSSSSLAQDAARLYTANSDNNSVSAIDKQGLTRVWEVAVGEHPCSIILGPSATLWVLNRDSANISVLAPASGQLIKQISLPPGTAPTAMVAATDDSAIYVSLSATGRLLKLNAGGNIVENIDVGPRPGALALSGDGVHLFVARFISPHLPAELTSVNGFDGQLPVAVVQEIDTRGFTLLRRYDLPYDQGPDTELSGRGVLNYLSSIQISPDGATALVTAKKDNVTRGLYRDGNPLTFESRIRAAMATLNLQTGTERLNARLDFNDRNMPIASAFSPFGDLFFVAFLGNDLVEVRDSNKPTGLLASINVGHAPNALLIDSTRLHLYVQNFLSRSVSVFDIAELVTAKSNTAPALAEVVTVAQEKLAVSVLQGKRIFYNASSPRISKDGYISCASCHLDGSDDGQLWDFTQSGEGVRNTINLQGRAGVAHGNVHWSGNFDEIQDFENDIRLGFGGTGLQSDESFAATRNPLGPKKAGLSEDLDALAAYVTSLNKVARSPYRSAEGQLTPSAIQGRDLFLQRGCAQCHSGAAFTDGKRHDVGTIQVSSGLGIHQPLADTGFRTPTLKGLWLNAPYLHNGQAADLGQVLQNPAHVDPAQVGELSEAEKTRLIDYLLQLDDGEITGQLGTPAAAGGSTGTSSSGSESWPWLLLLTLALVCRWQGVGKQRLA